MRHLRGLTEMPAEPEQLDVFGFEARRRAAANRQAADAARVAYNFPSSVREERVSFYMAEAERYEALAGLSNGERNE